MNRIPALALLVTLLLASSPALGGSLAQMTPDEVRGCIGMTPDGSRMACVGYALGRMHLEVKAIENRRLYRVFLLGTEEEPMNTAATPPQVLKRALEKLEDMGIVPLMKSAVEGDVFALPGISCGLGLEATSSHVQTVVDGVWRPWLAKDGVGGSTVLADVAVAPDRSKVFVVLDHVNPEGDGRLREFKVVHIDALLQRSECAPTPL